MWRDLSHLMPNRVIVSNIYEWAQLEWGFLARYFAQSSVVRFCPGQKWLMSLRVGSPPRMGCNVSRSGPHLWRGLTPVPGHISILSERLWLPRGTQQCRKQKIIQAGPRAFCSISGPCPCSCPCQLSTVLGTSWTLLMKSLLHHKGLFQPGGSWLELTMGQEHPGNPLSLPYCSE